MNKLLFLLLPLSCFGQPTPKMIAGWEQQARRVTIIRDQWGIPHIYGKSDADAVFGLLYAQCEDDFQRVEMNYIEKLGRLAEVKGTTALYDDLLMRMIIDSSEAIEDYRKAPSWMKKLCTAFADGINYYLYKHPGKKTALLRHFEPWYPFLWTDGSIGAINTADITSREVGMLYDSSNVLSSSYERPAPAQEEVLTGSNGFAFAPKITASGHAILYINPHVTFYFRPEVHMVSEEGLNAYGAVTWGQFFIYQGFNSFCGWMHTSSAVDAADTYREKIEKQPQGWAYYYDGRWLPLRSKPVNVSIKKGNSNVRKSFTAWYTHHGPVMAKRKGEWLSLRADNRISNGLLQCWLRTKAASYEDFQKSLDLKGNISNNTVYGKGFMRSPKPCTP
jgi:acyl-homoserine lactone acylase PvdQ